MAAAAGFEEAAPALRLHFGEPHRAPMPYLEALNADAGADAANDFLEHSDVRQYLVALRRARGDAGRDGEL